MNETHDSESDTLREIIFGLAIAAGILTSLVVFFIGMAFIGSLLLLGVLVGVLKWDEAITWEEECNEKTRN